jgi:hypothetical protein
MKRIMNDKQDLLKLDEIIFSGFNGAKAQEMEWKLPVLKLHERTRISPELKKATKEILKGYAKYKLAEARLKDLENGKDSDQEKIAAIRKEVEDWEKDFKTKKLMLPMISVHAYFDKGRKDSDPHTFNNLILTDIDHISEEQINELMPKIKKSPHVVFACRSVRGEGIHILNYVEVEGGINDENFKNVFNATTRLVEHDLNIEADKAVGSISRTMFLNYDEQAYYNPEATPLDINTAVLLEKIDINDLKFQEMTEKEKLTAYLDAAKTNLSWIRGKRHHELVSLVSTLNNAGFDLEDVIAECTSRYAQSDFDVEEIESTIRNVYKTYSSQHGTNRKSQQPNKDKGTKGHIDIVQDNNDDFVDEDEILPTKCPEADDVRDLIPDYFWDYIIPKNRDKNTRFVVLISFLVAVGAIFRKVRCLVRPNEIATGKLFYIVSGPAASGKSCIGRAYEIFRIHADKIESESQEEVQKGKEAYKNWKMCLNKCKEEDCGCGAEPVIPEQIRIKLSLNISSSKLIHQMGHNLDFPSLLYTTELDSNLDMKDNPLSPQLRAGYENEPISSHTHMHGDVSVNTPSMAILAAGTPAQLVNFLKNKENGLASRFLPSYLPESDYRKLEDENMGDYDTYMAQKEAFKGRAQTFSQYAMNAELTFELTTKSKQAIDACMEEIEKRYATFGSDELTSFIRRLTKMNVNMAIVLTTFDLYEKGISTGRHTIPDEIIDKVLCWNPYFIEQHIRLLSDLPDTPVNKDSNEIKYAHIFSKLPCDFTFAEACNIFSKHVDVSTKTVQRVLKKWVKAGKLTSAQKHYFRTDCCEIHTVA